MNGDLRCVKIYRVLGFKPNDARLYPIFYIAQRTILTKKGNFSIRAGYVAV